jgi:hypothetical protein
MTLLLEYCPEWLQDVLTVMLWAVEGVVCWWGNWRQG